MTEIEELKVKKNIVDNILDRNSKNQNIAAIEYFGNSITYKEFAELIDKYAKAFKQLGVKSNDVVTLCLAGTPDSAIAFYALNKIGAIANFVNPNYFKLNSKKYINDTNCKVLFILDKFYPSLKEEIARTNLEKIIFSSLSSYASLFDKFRLSNPFFKTIKKKDIIDNIEYFDLDSFLACAKGENYILLSESYIEGKEAGIFYTSGTTGNPKGVVLTNDGFNNMVSMYDALGGMDRKPGDRNLVVIPPMYATGVSHCYNAPFAFGCTNVLQPIYDKTTFASDLKKYKPNTVTAAGSHYSSALESNLRVGDLESLIFPCTGGEGLTEDYAREVSKELMRLGAKNPLIMGYGASEFGCMVMINQYLKGRTNEAGYKMPYVEARIVDPKTGKELSTNERGEVQVITPAIMKGYYQNEKATNNVYCYDENGKRWAKTGDLGSCDENGVYRVYGRILDSFIDENGQIQYLFDYENIMAKHNSILECEAIAGTIDGKKVPIIHVVLKKDKQKNAEKVLLELHKMFIENGVSNIPYCYKIRKEFSTSPISGKRDYSSLIYETDDFIRINNDLKMEKINIYPEEAKTISDIHKVKTMKI